MGVCFQSQRLKTGNSNCNEGMQNLVACWFLVRVAKKSMALQNQDRRLSLKVAPSLLLTFHGRPAGRSLKFVEVHEWVQSGGGKVSLHLQYLSLSLHRHHLVPTVWACLRCSNRQVASWPAMPTWEVATLASVPKRSKRLSFLKWSQSLPSKSQPTLPNTLFAYA